MEINKVMKRWNIKTTVRKHGGYDSDKTALQHD
jgi:hypothetical protein